MPDIFRKAFHLGIVGCSGTGKTEYEKRFFTQSRHDRVFIFDHQGEFPSRLGKLAAIETRLDNVSVSASEFRIVAYDPSEEFPGEYELGLAVWSDLIWDIAKVLSEEKKETLAVVDELQKLINPLNTPKELKTLVQTGRKFGLDTVFTSQQPNRMPNEIREQWTELATFRLKDVSSLESLDNFGFTDEEMELIRTLPDLHYIWRNLQTGETRKSVIKFD